MKQLNSRRINVTCIPTFSMSAAVHSDCSRLNAGTHSAMDTVCGTEYGTAVQHL
jgi:hypothetical protein